jgi:hypothetical protein
MMKRIGELKADLRNCITAIRVKDEENARLKAEVERLTKAGDDMWERLVVSGCDCCMVNDNKDLKAMDAWTDAKEGKQS